MTTIYYDPETNSYAAPYSGYVPAIWQGPSTPSEKRLTWDELVARWKQIGAKQQK